MSKRIFADSIAKDDNDRRYWSDLAYKIAEPQHE
jgi:hypothetical protein